jgi:hypothetical protein
MRTAVATALLNLLMAGGPQAAPHPPSSADAAPPQGHLAIRSRTDLDAYLRDHAGAPTPFDALPPGARERFFLSLGWGSSGLGSFDPGVLADELPQERIDAILQLFGEEIAGHAPGSRLPEGDHADAPPVAAGGIDALERRYNDFYRALRERGDPDPATHAARLGKRFDALLADAYAAQALQDIDDRHLAMLWNAAVAVAKLTTEPRHVAALEAAFAESARRSRGQPSGERLRAMRDVLLASRRFDDARRFSERYSSPALPPLPEFVEPPDIRDRPPHGIWRMSTDGNRLSRESIDLSGTRILVTAGCHFSLDAAGDISADPVLGPAFAKHASWLVLPPGVEDIDAVRDWNRRFPQAPALMIYDREGWPMLADWPMPEFHVVREGRIVESVTGWPRGDAHQREALIGMLRRAGLLDQLRPGSP